MVLAKARHYMPLHTLKNVCTSFSSTVIKKISPLQRKAVRVIIHFKGTITVPSLKISKAMDNISLKNCHLVHDSFNDKLPYSFNDFSLKATDLNSIGTRHPTSVYQISKNIIQ